MKPEVMSMALWSRSRSPQNCKRWKATKTGPNRTRGTCDMTETRGADAGTTTIELVILAPIIVVLL